MQALTITQKGKSNYDSTLVHQNQSLDLPVPLLHLLMVICKRRIHASIVKRLDVVLINVGRMWSIMLIDVLHWIQRMMKLMLVKMFNMCCYMSLWFIITFYMYDYECSWCILFFVIVVWLQSISHHAKEFLHLWKMCPKEDMF